MDNSWNNPWKLTAIAMALMIVTAVVTGIVVANRTGTTPAQQIVRHRPRRTHRWHQP